MKQRIIYFLLFILTMALGLLSRSGLVSLPAFIAAYSGDTLWALLVFWGFALLFPKYESWKLAVYALAFSYAIETSQLYQADWINSIRHTRMGGLVLGFGFKWSDLVCYTVGAFVGFGIDSFLKNGHK